MLSSKSKSLGEYSSLESNCFNGNIMKYGDYMDFYQRLVGDLTEQLVDIVPLMGGKGITMGWDDNGFNGSIIFYNYTHT